MRIVITGSSALVENNLEKYLPEDIDEIVSCGGEGIDYCAKKYALTHNIKYSEFMSRYDVYGDKAVGIRAVMIANYVDYALVFWDGESEETKVFADVFKRLKKTIFIIRRKKKTGTQR